MESFTIEVLLQEWTETLKEAGTSLERIGGMEAGKVVEEFCKMYTPPSFLPNPIILQSYKSWMKQKLERKRQHQWIFWVSLLMETRLKEKVGTQRTLSNVNVELSLPVPIWVTCTMSPLGNLT